MSPGGGPLFFQDWPTVIELRPSATVPPSQLTVLKKSAANIEKLVAEGRTVAVFGTFSGHLTLQTHGQMPAKPSFDDARDITVEAQPPANTLPVIPICGLFKDLGSWKEQRIAVRAEIASTMEGTWLSGHCESNFVTGGHRWPVLLTWGLPDYYGADPKALFRIDESRMIVKPSIPPELRGHQEVTRTATVVGRLRMRDQYIGRCRPGDDYIGNGFGHLGAAAAELIVESVLDAEVQPLLQTDDGESEPSCIPPNQAALCATSGTLEEAAKNECLDRVRELLATRGIDSKDGRPSGALVAAIRTGDKGIVRLLIKAGAPLNPSGYDFFRPLFLAAQWRRYELLAELIKAGADVNQDGGNGSLLATEGYFFPRVSKILLDAGADPNARDNRGATALMHASANGYEDEVKLLLEHNADVNLKDRFGQTALMYATAGQYVDAIPLLLAHGADALCRDVDGQNALDLAKKSHNSTAVELLTATVGGAR